MKLAYKPFDDFIKNNTTAKTRSRYKDSEICLLQIHDQSIDAGVLGSNIYSIHIDFNSKEVTSAQCSCPYDFGGYCKHIVHVLVAADKKLKGNHGKKPKKQEGLGPQQEVNLKKQGMGFVLKNQQVLDLTPHAIQTITQDPKELDWLDRYETKEARMIPNKFTGQVVHAYYDHYKVEVIQKEEDLHLSCSCTNNSKKICPHLKQVLLDIYNDDLLQIPFDPQTRRQYLEDEAEALGFGEVENLDDLFGFKLENNRVYIEPEHNFLPLAKNDVSLLKEELLPEFKLPDAKTAKEKTEFILAEQKGDTGFMFQLMEAPLAKNGNMKSPIRPVDLQEKATSLSERDEFLFLTALMQQEYTPDPSRDLSILKNPLELPFYHYESDWHNDKVTPKKIDPVNFAVRDIPASVRVKQKGGFYVLGLKVTLNGKKKSIRTLRMSGNYLVDDGNFYYIKNEVTRKLIDFFKRANKEIYLTPDQFKLFKEEVLDKLEKSVEVNYSFIKKAPKSLIKKQALDEITEHLIYLSESGDYILITPMMRYGEIEAPILSRQNIYAENDKGKMYVVERDQKAELRFQRNIQKMHPEFEEDPPAEFYYLHKQKFLDEGWFIDAFEEWRKHNYSILGFKQLKNNNLNPHKMAVKTAVSSGIDWFDIHTNIKFGDQDVDLKQIRKSVLNKNRYVKLGDGTKGILPEEWIDKFSKYFRSGEIKDDTIRTHKSHFGMIDELFEEEVLSADVKVELEKYKEKLANFHSIRNVEIPKNLNATLRDYQKEGLNWLNFLDEFGFGGCLADDMGLGKTIQLIAYFLSQIEKGNTAPNLVVVPTSLLFNWETEIKKFAPELNYRIAYGPNRDTENIPFQDYDVILTSYGTMLNDVEILKQIEFNVIVLDESQAIKNPTSKRYKAARLLRARQRLVATGTPVENNTFDLYAQLSFAVPGLLGSAKQFATDYSIPIDKFQDDKRAGELQQKVHPFILRRTKKQVADELPEKTEMVVQCEMGRAQRRVYDTYKKEFQQFLEDKDESELKSSNMHILQGLTKMRQICNTPALLSDDDYYGNQSAKLEELMVQIQKLQGEHKILVFSQFVSMLELIKGRLEKEDIHYAYLTGKTRKRQEQVDAFQEDDDVRVFLISLKAGGTGLNLTKAEYVFIVDPWWNPAVENQAIDRAYRIGQVNNVVAIRMITPDTIEEKIMQLQDRKKQLVEDLIHTDSGFFKQLNKDDLMAIV